MGTYNTYLNKRAEVGGHTPIWLGKVIPAPVGGNLASEFAVAGTFLPAGTPIELKNGVVTPFVCWEISSVDSTNHILTVKKNAFGLSPKVGDVLQGVGATFATTGGAGVVSAVAVNASDASKLDVTFTTAALDGLTVGSALAYSSATAAAASGKSLKVIPNYYLYNDISIDSAVENLCDNVEYSNIFASAGMVNFHGQGLLIERTPAALVKDQMAAAVPNVIQERRY